jgi:hypothetical protein
LHPPFDHLAQQQPRLDHQPGLAPPAGELPLAEYPQEGGYVSKAS